MEATQNILTVEELAIFLNCSTQLVRKLKREGKIPFIKIGYLVRFKLDDVVKALEEQTNEIS